MRILNFSLTFPSSQNTRKSSDFIRKTRGGKCGETCDILVSIYSGFTPVDQLKIYNKTAEIIKYTSSSLMAAAISFSNEICNFCGSLGGIDAGDVMKGLQLDNTAESVNGKWRAYFPSFLTYLEAGCGFGGICFFKDVMALSAHGIKMGSSIILRLLKSVLHRDGGSLSFAGI